jgi:conjugative transfer region lipoprotein (TIGR03751 family)
MHKIWINGLLAVLLIGCTTNKESLLAHDSQTMLQIWQAETGGSARGFSRAHQFLEARHALQGIPSLHAPTRTAANEITQQFHRLPNPDLVMFVFPHLAGEQPVPGYSTVFPFYQRVQYALPGERTENY